MKKHLALLLAFILCFGTFSLPTVAAAEGDTSVSDGVAEPISVAETTYTLTVKAEEDGTYTVSAALPAGVRTGKIVVSVSEDLQLVAGSLTSPQGGSAAINEAYNRDGVSGACVSFASGVLYDEGAVVFSASYRATEGDLISENDVNVPLWYLSNIDSVLGSNADGDVIKVFDVPEELSSADVTTEEPSSEDVSSEDVTSDDVSSDDVSSDDVTSDDVSSDDVTSEDVSSEDVSSEDVSSEDVTSDDISSDDVTSDDVSSEEPAPDTPSVNLLAGMSYTYDINAFFSSYTDNDSILLTDGIYRGNGVDWNDITGVNGVTVQMAGSYAKNVIEFSFDKATSIETLLMRGVHAFLLNDSVNRHLNVAALEVTKDGSTYTSVTYKVEYTPIEGAPIGVPELTGVEGPRFFNVTVTVEDAIDIKGFRLTLDTLRASGTNAYIVELDELEAYAPAAKVELPAEGTWGGLNWYLDEEYKLSISGEGAMDAFESGSDEAWLAYRDLIKSVEIGKGVTSISDYSFENCASISSITVGEAVGSVGKNAFYGCSSLVDLRINSPYIAATTTDGAANGYITANALSIAVKGAYTEVSDYIKDSFDITEFASYKGVLYVVYSKHQHDWQEYNLPGTDCADRGFVGYRCADCGEVKGYELVKHSYDDPCDADCNLCGEVRLPVHSFNGYTVGKYDHWQECVLCGYRKGIDPHYYEDDCDSDCDECGATRVPPHNCVQLWETDEENHWTVCEHCGVEGAKEAHSYDNEQDDTCSYCGYKRSIPHTVHEYDNDCDPDCNLCGDTREISHDYKNAEGYYQCTKCGGKLYTTPDGFVLTPKEGADCSLDKGFVTINDHNNTAGAVAAMFEGTVSVLGPDGAVLTGNAPVGTGCKVVALDAGGEILDYVLVVVKGDVDGDGKIAVTDYVALNRLMRNPNTASHSNALAGDLTGDGSLNAADLIALKIELYY